MMKIALAQLTIAQAKKSLAAGEYRAVDLAESYLAEIEKTNRNFNVYLEVFDDVLRQAAAADERLARGERLPLGGIPLALKDNILIKGRIASAASKILANYRASFDSTVVARLKEAGAIFLGRTNMDEFAMGSSTENSAFGPTKNPYDPSRVPGGSSGGAAAAVALNLCLASLGSDTGGSVRQPAAFCGVVGLKPTYGAVSRFGLIALASSLDQIGPLAKTVDDVELIFEVIRGRDAFDSTTTESPLGGLASKSKSKGRIGVPFHFLQDGVAPEVQENFAASLKRFQNLGYEIREVNLPRLKYSLASYYVIMTAEASSNLARFDGVRYGLYQEGVDLLDDYRRTRGAGFGPEARRRILLGTYVLSAGYYDAYYRRAVAVRELIKRDFAAAFKEVEMIVLPTTPTVAFRLGERLSNPLEMYLADIFTASVNLVGLPAISLPAGRNSTGLPFGLQLIAPRGGEETVFAAGKDFMNYD